MKFPQRHADSRVWKRKRAILPLCPGKRQDGGGEKKEKVSFQKHSPVRETPFRTRRRGTFFWRGKKKKRGDLGMD